MNRRAGSATRLRHRLSARAQSPNAPTPSLHRHRKMNRRSRFGSGRAPQPPRASSPRASPCLSVCRPARAAARTAYQSHGVDPCVKQNMTSV